MTKATHSGKRGRYGAPSLSPEASEHVQGALREALATFEGKRLKLAAALGISRQALTKLLMGTSSASYETATRVARVLGIDVGAVLEGRRPRGRLRASDSTTLARVLERMGDLVSPDVMRVVARGVTIRELSETEWLVALTMAGKLLELVEL